MNRYVDRAQWERLSPLFQTKPDLARHDVTHPIRAIRRGHRALAGGAACRWRDLPAERFGPWRTVYAVSALAPSHNGRRCWRGVQKCDGGYRGGLDGCNARVVTPG
jgi:transposase